jgi:hypothetical protein
MILPFMSCSCVAGLLREPRPFAGGRQDALAHIAAGVSLIFASGRPLNPANA